MSVATGVTGVGVGPVRVGAWFAWLLVAVLGVGLLQPLVMDREAVSTAAATTPPDFVLPASEDPPWNDNLSIGANAGLTGLSSLPLEAQLRVNAGVGEADSRFHFGRGPNGELNAGNPDQDFRVSFNNSGPVLRADGYSLGVSLIGAGYGRAVLSARPAVASTPAANAVTFARGGVTERYDNGPLGLAQRFDIAAPPTLGDRRDGLTVAFDVTGGLVPKQAENERALTFQSPDGKEVFGYDHLKVLDANGRSLPARLETTTNPTTGNPTVLIRVIDTDAHYPITIDPIFSVALIDTSSAPDQYGYSVATYGYGTGGAGGCGAEAVQTIAVGAPAANVTVGGTTHHSAGTVLFLAEYGNSWVESAGAIVSQDQYWGTQPAPQANARFGESLDLNSGWSECQPALIVGAPDYDRPGGPNLVGAAFVYSVRVSEDPQTPIAQPFELRARLTLENFSTAHLNINPEGSKFGAAVAISVGETPEGEKATALVGAPWQDIDSEEAGFIPFGGAAYVFQENNSSWVESPESTTWAVMPSGNLVPTLGADAWTQSGHFGLTVAMTNEGRYSTLVVSAPHQYEDAGRVYVWNKRVRGWGSPEHAPPSDIAATQMLKGEDQNVDEVTRAGDQFGFSLAIHADLKFKVFVFDEWDVDIASPLLIVGAPYDKQTFSQRTEGSARVFQLNPSGSWIQKEILIACPHGKAGSRFGYSVSMDADGERVMVGAPGYKNTGRLFSFLLSGTPRTTEYLSPLFRGAYRTPNEDSIEAPTDMKSFARDHDLDWEARALIVAGGTEATIASSISVYRNSLLLEDRDSGFDGDGRGVVDFGGVDVGGVVGFGGDGRAVVGGVSDGDLALARVLPDGGLDSSFGVGGLVVSDVGGVDELVGLSVLSDGSVVGLGRSSGWDFVLARWDGQGVLDSSFGVGGVVTVDVGGVDVAAGLSVLGDGRFVLAGSSGGDFVAAVVDGQGVLDSSFGVGGVARVDLGGSDVVSGVSVSSRWVGEGDAAELVQRIVVAGSSGGNVALAVFDEQGGLDTSFSGDGKVVTDVGGVDSGNAVTALDDGSVVVAGASGSDVALVKYTPAGALDAGFGDGDGVAVTNFGGSDSAFEVGVSHDGKILIAGGGGNSADVVLARFWASNGALDASFGVGGKASTNFGATDTGFGMDIRPNGDVVVVGGSADNFALARFTPEGLLDSGFDGDGKLVTDLGGADVVYATVVQPDGRIVAAGTADNHLLIARYLPSGVLDTSFSGDGKTTVSVADFDVAYGVVLDEAGRIVVAGRAGSSSNATVVRLRPDGSLDPMFSGDGVATLDLGGFDLWRAVAVDGGGRIVLAGYVGPDMAVARFSPDGSLDPTFSGDGKTTIDVNGEDAAYAMRVLTDGRILIGGKSAGGFTLARLYDTGVLDATFGDGGVVSTNVGATSGVSALDVSKNGVITAAGDGDGDFVLARYLPDGSLDEQFATSGVRHTDLGGSDRAYAVRVDAAGIVAAGTGGAGQDIALACYRPNGEPDTGGCAESATATMTYNLAGADKAYAMSVETDGSTVLAGASGADSAFMRFESTTLPPVGELPAWSRPGGLAVGFGTNGTGSVLTGLGSLASIGGAARQLDGKIVVAATVGPFGSTDVLLARYSPDGVLDTDFGVSGTVVTDLGSTSDSARGVTVLANGRIVLAGMAGGDIALAGYTTDGVLDTGFGASGITLTNLGGFDSAEALIAHPDGWLAVAGTNGTDAAVAAYTPDGQLFDEFGGDGIATLDWAGTDRARALTPSGAGLIVAGSNGANFALARLGRDGTLDTSFSGDGMTTIDISPGQDGADAVTVKPDERILIGGNAGFSSDTAIVQLLPDGTLDTSFSGDGITTTDFGGTDPISADSITTLTLLPGGQFLAAGANSSDQVLARYNSDGSLDTTFDNDGLATTNLGGADEAAAAFTTTTTTGAPAYTIAGGGGPTQGITLTRYTPTGALDIGYSNDGNQSDAFNGTSQGYLSTAQPDGKTLVAAKTGNNNFTILRYNTDGSLDTTFDNDGWTNTDMGSTDTAYITLLQPDGKIIASGISGNKHATARYNPDGSLDTTFSGDGKYTATWGTSTVFYGAALQPDGKIVLAGYTLDGADKDIALFRFNPNGTPDTTFDADGAVKTNLGSTTDAAYRITIQPDGKILAAGETATNAAIVRYNTNGSLDTTFNNDGIYTQDFGTTGDQAESITLREDGQIWVGANTNTDYMILRLHPNGTPDTTFDNDGTKPLDLGGNEHLTNLTQTPTGQLLATGTGGPNQDFTLTLINPNGTPDTTYANNGTLTINHGNNDIPYHLTQNPNNTLTLTGTTGTTINTTTITTNPPTTT